MQSAVSSAEALYEKINRHTGKAINDFDLIQQGDRILAAVSGGKDSLLMARLLADFQKKAPVDFEILAVNLDQGQPGFDSSPLAEQMQEWQIPFHAEYQDTYSVVLEKTRPGKSYCAVCSRLRRGVLYRIARERGFNKIALGHHREDLINTFIMNAFYAGKLGTMPPVYTVAEGDLKVIRPLVNVPEDLIVQYVQEKGWKLIPCNLCGSQEGLKRQKTNELLMNLEKEHPGVKASLFGALSNLHTDELLDRSLWTGSRFNDAGEFL